MGYTYPEAQEWVDGHLSEMQTAFQVAVRDEYHRCFFWLPVLHQPDPLQIMQPVLPLQGLPRSSAAVLRDLQSVQLPLLILWQHHYSAHDIGRWPLLKTCFVFCAQQTFQHGTLHECLDGTPTNSSCHGYGQTTTGNSGCGLTQTSMVRCVPGIVHTSQSTFPKWSNIHKKHDLQWQNYVR